MLYVVHPNQWRAEFLNATYSNGEAPINTSKFVEGKDGIWQPGSFVSLYHLCKSPWQFDDTPWWSLPSELLGRRVRYCVGAEEVVAALSTDFAETGFVPGKAFIKLAKHKYPHFVAAILDKNEFQDRRDSHPFIDNHDFIVSQIVDVVEECRNWVINDVVAHSGVYASGDWQWSGEKSHVPVDSEHIECARAAASLLGLSATVVDTGRLADGRVVVVETNPPWCSGFYDAPAEVVREATLLSQGLTPRLYPFEPDRAAAEGLKNHPWLQ